jgi:hypothetical protein
MRTATRNETDKLVDEINRLINGDPNWAEPAVRMCESCEGAEATQIVTWTLPTNARVKFEVCQSCAAAI